MNAVKRVLVTGLMAAALLTSTVGFQATSAYASVHDEVDAAIAAHCQGIRNDLAATRTKLGQPGLTEDERERLQFRGQQLVAAWTKAECGKYPAPTEQKGPGNIIEGRI